MHGRQPALASNAQGLYMIPISNVKPHCHTLVRHNRKVQNLFVGTRCILPLKRVDHAFAYADMWYAKKSFKTNDLVYSLREI